MLKNASRASLFAIAFLGAGAAFAATHAVEVQESREAIMKEMGKSLGVLGKMAKGQLDYDAATATAAATALKDAAEKAHDPALWPEGTDTMSIDETRAMPDIWDNMADFEAKGAALIEASIAMEAAAAEGLQPMQAAMGNLGGSCGGCHKVYRAPEE
ncbi:cytochrome c [Vannielia sp.]|uniref:c-type cytochrome n=1 Tax=Vannielia sp. TaxID=2813045 RepID=UPI00262B6455|nr:cytochrome c [Vannielia sp.]MDF1872611.1 cytochrome c [Vannielia sp.]